jgi:hypothetical protein
MLMPLHPRPRLGETPWLSQLAGHARMHLRRALVYHIDILISVLWSARAAFSAVAVSPFHSVCLIVHKTASRVYEELGKLAVECRL